MTRRLGTPRLKYQPASANQTYRMANADILLQHMEGPDALRVRKSVVLAAMYDQHRRSPLVDEVRGVVSNGGARVRLLECSVSSRHCRVEDVLREVLLCPIVPRTASPLFVELRGRHVRARRIAERTPRHARKRARQWSSRCTSPRRPGAALLAPRLSSCSCGATHAIVAD